MQHILLLVNLLLFSHITLFDFSKKSNLSNWIVVDDGVMGGLSEGNLKLNSKGHAIFYGAVSLENNGGFSSVRYRFEKKQIEKYNAVQILLKGDGKKYQFRVKTNSNDRHSYIYDFKTSGKWETITIPLSEMLPSFRGYRLDIPNYPNEELSEVAFLIANKRTEEFKLEIDKIDLVKNN